MEWRGEEAKKAKIRGSWKSNELFDYDVCLIDADVKCK
jgi:hypothetical protein